MIKCQIHCICKICNFSNRRTVRRDGQLVAQIGLEKSRVAAPEVQPAGDFDLVPLQIRVIFLGRRGVGLRERAQPLPRLEAFHKWGANGGLKIIWAKK